MGGASRFIMLLTTPFPLLHHSRPSLLRLARHSRLCSSFSSLPHLNNSPASRLQSVSPVKSSEKLHTQTSGVQEDQFGSSSNPPTPSHPWPEWSKFIETLSNSRHFEQQRLPEDEFVAYSDVSEEFVRSSSACLAFARERWELLGSLSRRDMMAIVENGTPFIFKSALDTSRRMRAFLGIGGSNVLESDKAHTVDLMKYLLSYASNPVVSPEKSGHYRGELIEASVRNLLSELCRLNNGVAITEQPASVHNHLPDGHEQLPMAPQQNITMKRGDWICSRCSFMNFARNSKCLECEEMRPKRQLTGGEWECPQCDFYNYGRNVVCLRCDCKRPGDTSVTSTSPGLGYRNEVSADKADDIDSRLVASEDDAQHWVTKISQMVSSSGMASTSNDMNFKKTSLDRRRLANSHYRKNLDDDGSVQNINFQVKGGSDTPSSRKIDEILGHQPTLSEADEIDEILGHQPPLLEADEILGHQPTPSEADEIDEVLGHQPSLSEADEIDDILGHHPTLSEAERTQPASFSSPPQKNYPKGNNSSYVPFVPLPNDMFAKKPRDLDMENEKMVPESTISDSSKSTTSVNQPEREDNEKPEADKSGSWLDKIAELHDVKDLSSAIQDFPDIMPMRKGENRFVVSKKKDRSLTTPMYKRKTAMEQTGSPSFVPFVPFPPDYFAKKNEQPCAAADPGSALKATSETSSTSENHPAIEKMGNQPRTVNYATSGRNGGSAIEPPVDRSSRLRDSISHNRDSISQQPESSDVGGGGWKGKSLEGSAVEEPDPLDMSEEAKAQRWFRRVAQIKDISELSDIPDEDFPSIMPMRKGVNRFVVSKRKTPLERRLTTSQYRKNSDPFKNGNDSS